MTVITLTMVAFCGVAVGRLVVRAADRRWWLRLRAILFVRAVLRLHDALLQIVLGEPDFKNPILVATLTYVDIVATRRQTVTSSGYSEQRRATRGLP
jgi:hypothetical protein